MELPPAPDALFLALQTALAGRYSLERELGRGGMGIVYLARDVRLDRPVALKLLPPDRAAVPVLRERFLREARMAARLAHPNIVPIHAVEEIGEFVFYAMRYVAGETLGDRLRRLGRLPAGETARILRDTAYALAYAHAQGVIHRDVKPDNILLEADGGRAVVTDFGIARLVDAPELSGGRVVGTPDYVAPEQAAGEEVDGRSDLYALGAVGFHCLAGRPPFEGDVPQLLAQHMLQPVPSILAVAPDTPPILAQTIDRALEKLPDERFETAEAMAEAMTPGSGTTGELPVPVRVWVNSGNDLKGIYVILSCFFYGVGSMILAGNLLNGRVELTTWVVIGMFYTAALTPWIGHGLWRLGKTRRALESGVTLDDLRAGLDVAIRQREEEMRYEAQRPTHVIARLARWGTYAAFTGVLAALFGGVFISRTLEMSERFFGMFAISTLLTVAGGMFGLVFPGRRLKPVDTFTRLRRWFWHGPLGDAMGRLALWGLPATMRSWGASRPTEMALGSATETLFAALPEADRAALADLPRVVNRLEREAAVAREQLAQGQDDIWAERLQRAVAAIETLRLGLLRMSAGQVKPGQLTADLEVARDLSERISYLMSAGDEVADLLSASSDSGHHQSAHPLPSSSPASTSLG